MQHADFPNLKSPDSVVHILSVPGEFCSVLDQGRSSDLRVILQAPSRLCQSVVVLPFVVAYSGGSVEEFHLTSLSSPYGHRWSCM